MRYTTLKALCKRICFEMKSLGLLLIAPLIFVHLLLPLASYILSRNNPDEYLSYIIMLGMLIVPVSSIMWGLFILKENVEGNGNELLYIGNNKIKLLDFLIPFALFCLTVTVHFGIYIYFVKAMLLELIRLLGICFLYFGATYLLVFLTKSTSLSLMTLIIYTIVAFLFSSKPNNFILYMNLTPFEAEQITSNTVPQIILGLLFTFGGLMLNKRFHRFN